MPDEDLVKMTVAIPRTLWRSAKIRAAEQDRGLREIVIESLETYLSGGIERQPGESRKKGEPRGVR
jgi:hypothetical protein